MVVHIVHEYSNIAVKRNFVESKELWTNYVYDQKFFKDAYKIGLCHEPTFLTGFTKMVFELSNDSKEQQN